MQNQVRKVRTGKIAWHKKSFTATLHVSYLRHAPGAVGALAAHRDGDVVLSAELDRRHHVLDAGDHGKGDGFGADGQILVPRSEALGVELFFGGRIAADQEVASQLGGEGLEQGCRVFGGRRGHDGCYQTTKS